MCIRDSAGGDAAVDEASEFIASYGVVEIEGRNLGEDASELLEVTVRGHACASLHWESPSRASCVLTSADALSAPITADCIVATVAAGVTRQRTTRGRTTPSQAAVALAEGSRAPMVLGATLANAPGLRPHALALDAAPEPRAMAAARAARVAALAAAAADQSARPDGVRAEKLSLDAEPPSELSAAADKAAAAAAVAARAETRAVLYWSDLAAECVMLADAADGRRVAVAISGVVVYGLAVHGGYLYYSDASRGVLARVATAKLARARGGRGLAGSAAWRGIGGDEPWLGEGLRPDFAVPPGASDPAPLSATSTPLADAAAEAYSRAHRAAGRGAAGAPLLRARDDGEELLATSLAEPRGVAVDALGTGLVFFAVAGTSSICHAPAAPPAAGGACLLYTSPSPRDGLLSRMPSSA